MRVLFCQVHGVGVVTRLTKHLDCRFHIEVDLTLTCLQEQKRKDGPSATFLQSTSNNHFSQSGDNPAPLQQGKDRSHGTEGVEAPLLSSPVTLAIGSALQTSGRASQAKNPAKSLEIKERRQGH